MKLSTLTAIAAIGITAALALAHWGAVHDDQTGACGYYINSSGT